MALKTEIEELGIIRTGKSHFSIKRSFISKDFMMRINSETINCRDNLSERIYWIMNDIKDYPHCIQCGSQFKPRFYGLKTAYQNATFCSRKCISSNENIISSKQQTCLDRYGDPNFRNIQKVYETSMQIYGVEHFTKSPIVKQNTEENNFRKIGHKNYYQAEASKIKSKQTCLERYGTEFYSQTDECKQKMQATSMDRYGVPYPTQDPTILKRILTTGVKRKAFELPNGLIHFYQGYEDVALKILLLKYNVDEIIMDIKQVPIINYNNGHRYYPDFFIASENLLIEVKSNHTYYSQIIRNTQKANAAVMAGFNFEFWICGQKQLKDKIQWRIQ